MAVGNVELKHFQRRVDVYKTILTREPLPIRIMLQSESSNIYPDIPHSWVCKGKMLRLHDPANPSNYKIFQVTNYNFPPFSPYFPPFSAFFSTLDISFSGFLESFSNFISGFSGFHVYFSNKFSGFSGSFGHFWEFSGSFSDKFP